MRKKGQKWTYEKLLAEARKYNTKIDFQKGNPNAHRASLRHGILDKICEHMEGTPRRKSPYVKWTDEMLFAEARNFKTRFDFQKGNLNAYQRCHRRGLLDKVCQHMSDLPHWDKPHCVFLIEIFTTNDELYYYIGKSSNLKNRLREHFRKGSDSPVSDFLNKTPIKFKKHYVVKDNLTYKESIKLEKDTIKDLKNRGCRLLNKVLYTM